MVFSIIFPFTDTLLPCAEGWDVFSVTCGSGKGSPVFDFQEQNSTVHDNLSLIKRLHSAVCTAQENLLPLYLPYPGEHGINIFAFILMTSKALLTSALPLPHLQHSISLHLASEQHQLSGTQQKVLLRTLRFQTNSPRLTLQALMYVVNPANFVKSCTKIS